MFFSPPDHAFYSLLSHLGLDPIVPQTQGLAGAKENDKNQKITVITSAFRRIFL